MCYSHLILFDNCMHAGIPYQTVDGEIIPRVIQKCGMYAQIPDAQISYDHVKPFGQGVRIPGFCYKCRKAEERKTAPPSKNDSKNGGKANAGEEAKNTKAKDGGAKVKKDAPKKDESKKNDDSDSDWTLFGD